MEIKLRNVSYCYKKVNYKDKPILEDINISFKKEKINAIIGENGQGKTTLLELINLNILPTKGSIKIDDFTYSSRKEEIFSNLKIGYVEQEEDFISNTIIEELEYAMESHNYKSKNKFKRMNDVLIMVDLNKELDEKIKNLSKPERRKLALARVLIYNPDTLILDDITKRMDVKNKNNLIKLIRLLKTRYNKTIIIASNDLDFIHKIADYIYVLYDKKIILEGTKYDVFKEEETLKKYGLDVPNVIKFSNKVLNKKNIKIGYRDEINDLIKDIYRFVK